jgi:hypothetical protein
MPRTLGADLASGVLCVSVGSCQSSCFSSVIISENSIHALMAMSVALHDVAGVSPDGVVKATTFMVA